jgi:DNA polymerase (family 10)
MRTKLPPGNVEIAAMFSDVADLLELQGANPFRIRAYRNAVRAIGNLTRSLADMVQEGADLMELPGIGHDLAQYIEEIVRTGGLGLLRELEEQLPASLVELMRIEGLGPKRAQLLYERLGIDSARSLGRAIASGRLKGVRGIGPKTIEKLRRGVAGLEMQAKRFRLFDADLVVHPLLDHMRQCESVERVEVAGSYRRRRETVGDIDILAISARPAKVMRHFTAFPQVASVAATGRTRATIVLQNGLHVDLRVVPRRCYGAALHYFTGSKAHNIAVRRLGVERGLRISEYGVFRVPKGKRLAEKRIGGAEEEDVFRAVGLAWVPPELREDRGEIDAARTGRLPHLIECADMRGDLQMHTTWSDGNDSIEAMVAACEARGYEYMAITDHSRSSTVAGGLDARALARQVREIERVRRRHPGIRIFHGMEVDILPDGSLDFPDRTLARLDLIVVSVHSAMGRDRRRMTDRVIRALSHPGVHILAHPTGRLINRREPYDIDLEAVLSAAAEYGVAVELNAQPDRLDLDDVHARRARDLGVSVVINTDAHSAETLSFMECGVDQARRAWLEPRHVLNTSGVDEMEAWLAERRRKLTPSTRQRRARATAH